MANKGGRPQKEIDWAQFENLCGLHCTEIEIAEWFQVSVDTIGRAVQRKYKEGFAETFKKKSSRGRVSLRRKQYEVAMTGNATMLIWLGKQYLGQSDKLEQVQTETETKLEELGRLSAADPRTR